MLENSSVRNNNGAGFAVELKNKMFTPSHSYCDRRNKIGETILNILSLITNDQTEIIDILFELGSSVLIENVCGVDNYETTVDNIKARALDAVLGCESSGCGL